MAKTSAGRPTSRNMRLLSQHALNAIQLNDVFVDDRSVLYTVDRLVGGLYIFELRLSACARHAACERNQVTTSPP